MSCPRRDATVGRHRRVACAVVAALVVLLVLPACTPALDWRAVDLPDTALVAEFPCRPSRFERQVEVAETALTLFMLSCEAQGITYGLATAEVADPQRVQPVLRALADAARAALHAQAQPLEPFTLAGATPFPDNVSAHIRGLRPDGRLTEESLRVFARGTRVFQASAVGPLLSDAAREPFERGLRFELEKPHAGPK